MYSYPEVGIPLALEARHWFLQVATGMPAMLPSLCIPLGQRERNFVPLSVLMCILVAANIVNIRQISKETQLEVE